MEPNYGILYSVVRIAGILVITGALITALACIVTIWRLLVELRKFRKEK